VQPFIHNNRVSDIFTMLATPHKNSREAFSVQTKTTGRQDMIVSVLAGKLSLEQIPEFAASLRKLLTGAVQVIVLDVSRVDEFSPNAASVLINFVSFVEGGDKRLILFRPSRCVQTVLNALHLTHLFTIQRTEDELLLEIPD